MQAADTKYREKLYELSEKYNEKYTNWDIFGNAMYAWIYTGMMTELVEITIIYGAENASKTNMGIRIEVNRDRRLPVSYTHLDVYKRQTKDSARYH